jgi:hypothetical protein
LPPLLRTLDALLLLVLEEARARSAGRYAQLPLTARAWPLTSATVYHLAGRADLADWIRRTAP